MTYFATTAFQLPGQGLRIVTEGQEVQIEDEALIKRLLSDHLISEGKMPATRTTAPSTPADLEDGAEAKIADVFPGKVELEKLPKGLHRNEKGEIKGVLGSKWTYNPRGLQEHSLEILNMMIADVDPSVGAVSTVEEAIAILSRDYEKARLLGVKDGD